LNRDFLRIAVITGSHSLKGRLKIFIISDILDRFSSGSMVYLYIKGSYKPYEIEHFQPANGKIGLLKLKGIDDKDTSDLLKKIEIFIDKTEADDLRDSLDEDTFFYHELYECKVYYKNDIFGSVVDIMQAGAGEILVVEDNSGKQHMIPFVESMIDTSKVREQIITIDPVEGLLEF
jgi:16S rRNA processing protein RimM